ncbi:MAG: NADAR family protein [Chlamydiota bacterium]
MNKIINNMNPVRNIQIYQQWERCEGHRSGWKAKLLGAVEGVLATIDKVVSAPFHLIGMALSSDRRMALILKSWHFTPFGIDGSSDHKVRQMMEKRKQYQAPEPQLRSEFGGSYNKPVVSDIFTTKEAHAPQTSEMMEMNQFREAFVRRLEEETGGRWSYFIRNDLDSLTSGCYTTEDFKGAVLQHIEKFTPRHFWDNDVALISNIFDELSFVPSVDVPKVSSLEECLAAIREGKPAIKFFYEDRRGDKTTCGNGHNETYYARFANTVADAVHFAGQDWPTAEHAFQAQKFRPGTPGYQGILNSTNPGQLRRLVQNYKLGLRYNNAQWHGRGGEDRGVKFDLMYEIVKAKVQQYPEIKAMLLATGDLPIVEWSNQDDDWGICRNDHHARSGSRPLAGKNYLGLILMRIREELYSSDINL